MNTMGEILVKKSVNFLNALFLEKKGLNNANQDIILFTYSRVRNLKICFTAKLWMFHSKMIVLNQSLFTDSTIVCSEER